MGLGSRYAKFLRKEQRLHAVWPPAASAVAVGDYGGFDDGVFVRLGNIAEYSVKFAAARTEGGSRLLRLSSSGATVTRIQGGGEVPNISPVVGVDATIRIRYKDAYSFMLRARELIAHEMVNKLEVARGLSQALGWRSGPFGLLVVSKVVRCEQFLLLATKESGTSVEFNGDAKVLAEFDGKAGLEGGVTMQANKAMALEHQGSAAPIGLELFRVAKGGGLVPRSLPDGSLEPLPITQPLLLEENNWEVDYPLDWA